MGKKGRRKRGSKQAKVTVAPYARSLSSFLALSHFFTWPFFREDELELLGFTCYSGLQEGELDPLSFLLSLSLSLARSLASWPKRVCLP